MPPVVVGQRHPTVRAPLLTTSDLDENASGSLQAGASALLLKSATAEALVDAVRTVAGGKAVVAPRVTTRLAQCCINSTRTLRFAPRHRAYMSPGRDAVLVVSGIAGVPTLARGERFGPIVCPWM